MNLKTFYSKKKDYYKRVNKLLNARIFWLGWARLLTFLGFGGCIFLFFRNNNPYGWLVLGLLLLVIFLLLVKTHIRLFDRREAIRHLIQINENELNVLQNQSSYLNDGAAFHNDTGYLPDLDVFGHRSLFHLLNRTATELGENRLASLLQAPLSDRKIIEDQQVAIAELAQTPDFRQHFLAQGLRTRVHPPDYNRLLAWIDSPSEFLGSRFIRFVRISMPILFLIALTVSILSKNLSPFLFMFFANFGVSGWYGHRITKIHASISKNVESLGAFAELFKLVNGEKFQSNVLRQIHQETTEAHRQLSKLDTIARFFDQRLNVVVYILLTGSILYDIQCVFGLEKWKHRNQHRLRQWLNGIAELEMLNSLATFRFNHPEYAMPIVSDGAPFIEATDLAHPLIPAHECVSNDFKIGRDKRLYIVTGSNMSGKSTFLRTVGVNVLLARCGAPVCAGSFSCSPMAIYSSLRQSDSLQDHVSTFYAELRKLQAILEGLEQDAHALVLLDEVLRGTNSDDKLYGSQQLVKRLIDLGAVGLLATHDIELAKMEAEYPQTLGNLCFESTITGGELLFDYKIREGVAQNRNATFLMQKMGIIGRESD